MTLIRASGSSRRADARCGTIRARSAATGLAAIAALVALAAGPPALLYQLAGPPLPRRLPGWHQVMTALSSQDDGALVLAVIRDGTWLAWLLFTACVLAEAHAVIRGRPARRRLGGIQGAAARLVALAAVAVSTATASTATASTLPASAATVTGQLTSHLQGGGPAQPDARPLAVVQDTVTVSNPQFVWL
jgi:hypothetical protein